MNTTILDEQGVAFFRKELLEETDKQISQFELASEGVSQRELGRIRLYEERAKIRRHFEICDSEIGAFLNNAQNHGLLGKLKQDVTSAGLTWKEIEGMRHSLQGLLLPDLNWQNNQPPKSRLTEQGQIVKKINAFQT